MTILRSEPLLNEPKAKLQIRQYRSKRYVVVVELWERTEYFLEYFDRRAEAEKFFEENLPKKFAHFRKPDPSKDFHD
jgi:hypothetical protein